MKTIHFANLLLLVTFAGCSKTDEGQGRPHPKEELQAKQNVTGQQTSTDEAVSARIPFRNVEIDQKLAEIVISKLDTAHPNQSLLKSNISSLETAAIHLHNNLNYVPPKRVAQYKDWVFFPRINHAGDDGSFSSGYAVKIGTHQILSWNLEPSS